MNGEKGMLTEGGIRTPFIVSWKGTIPGGQVYKNAVISLDVAATANELAGLPIDPALDGVNLMPFLTGKNPGAPHDLLFWRWAGQSAVRKGDWKYLAGGDRQYLFNLANDPEEKHDLLAKHPELGRQLRGHLEKWSQGLMPPGLVPANLPPAGSGYFDHYLDGKKKTDPSTVDPERKKRRKAKAEANEVLE
jgi:uncharacterized sulfatase